MDDSSNWETHILLGSESRKLPKHMPAFTKGGEVMLYMFDTFDHTNVPVVYEITQVIFDVYSQTPRQYVRVEKRMSDE